MARLGAGIREKEAQIRRISSFLAQIIQIIHKQYKNFSSFAFIHNTIITFINTNLIFNMSSALMAT